MTHYLVTGASGLLGLNLALHLSKEHQVTGVIHKDELKGVPFEVIVTDLSKPGECERVMQATMPQVVIHCAAMAIVDECELDPQRAIRVNADVPGELAGLALHAGTKFLHISTDAVFDGIKGDYKETDQPNPLSTYARTKLAGEVAVMAENPGALTARVNFYGWSLRGKRSLAEFFFNNLTAGKKVNGFTDVKFSPLLVNDLIEILLEMCAKDFSGLYHTVSSETVSKYDFGVAIAKEFGFDSNLVQPVSVNEGGLKAARSPNLNLNTSKLVGELDHPLPGIVQGLKKFHQLFNEYYPQELITFAKDE
jgi:dTDP-4-dehydrorhamnose reductase